MENRTTKIAYESRRDMPLPLFVCTLIPLRSARWHCLINRVVGNREAWTRRAASEPTAMSMTFRDTRFILFKPDIDPSISITYVMVADMSSREFAILKIQSNGIQSVVNFSFLKTRLQLQHHHPAATHYPSSNLEASPSYSTVSFHCDLQYKYPCQRNYLVFALGFFATTLAVMVCGLDRISCIAVQALASSDCSRNSHVGSYGDAVLADLGR